MSKLDQPVNHAPSSVWPQPTNVVAYLRDNARHGATLVTRNGVSVVETGHATRMENDGVIVAVPLFAPLNATLVARYADTSAKAQLD